MKLLMFKLLSKTAPTFVTLSTDETAISPTEKVVHGFLRIKYGEPTNKMSFLSSLTLRSLANIQFLYSLTHCRKSDSHFAFSNAW